MQRKNNKGFVINIFVLFLPIIFKSTVNVYPPQVPIRSNLVSETTVDVEDRSIFSTINRVHRHTHHCKSNTFIALIRIFKCIIHI